MKGIILAGGSGTRLFPITIATSKQLMPIYDKPMIYYPLSVLMLAGIQEILIISTPQDIGGFERLLQDGSQFGLHFSYAIQETPRGLADAFIVGRDFVGNDLCCLILGDNIFYGHDISKIVRDAAQIQSGAVIFGYAVRDPERYGVAEINALGQVLSLEEKPSQPKSNLAVPGLYFYDNRVLDIAANLKPSARGEIEITDINRTYMEMGELNLRVMGRGIAWLDTGTHESLLDASTFVQIIETRQGLKIACLEEIAYNMGYISLAQLEQAGLALKNNQYGRYILNLVKTSQQ